MCERLTKTSLALAVTPSAGDLIVWQTANKPTDAQTEKQKTQRRFGTSANEARIQRRIVPPGTPIVLTSHPPADFGADFLIFSTLFWDEKAAGDPVDKQRKKYREHGRERWRGGGAA